MMKKPLEVVKDKIKELEKKFPEYRVEEIVVDVKLGGKLFFGRAGLVVTLKKKDS